MNPSSRRNGNIIKEWFRCRILTRKRDRDSRIFPYRLKASLRCLFEVSNPILPRICESLLYRPSFTNPESLSFFFLWSCESSSSSSIFSKPPWKLSFLSLRCRGSSSFSYLKHSFCCTDSPLFISSLKRYLRIFSSLHFLPETLSPNPFFQMSPLKCFLRIPLPNVPLFLLKSQCLFLPTPLHQVIRLFSRKTPSLWISWSHKKTLFP